MNKKLIIFILTFFVSLLSFAAPKSDLWPFWDKSNDSNTSTISHTDWQIILDNYLSYDAKEQIHLFDYSSLNSNAQDKKILEDYINTLTSIKIRDFSKREQLAYWINLYNAVTLKLILDEYPVDSIRDIGSLFTQPWDIDLIVIEGQDVTLNDIEHRILRPIWKDPRIHYVVNCASISCPDLAPTAFTAVNTDDLMTAQAKAYINNKRGVNIENNRLLLSSIYDWYEIDFGNNLEEVIEHLKIYAEDDLSSELSSFTRARYDYNWDLNEKK